MAIKKNFKIISEDKHENTKEQEEILLSTEEKGKISDTLSLFFDTVKTLLREGAVLIDTNPTEHSLEEDFLNNPSLKNTRPNLHTLAFKVLSPERAEKIFNSIEGFQMNENYDFEINSSKNADATNFMQTEISKHLKDYSLQLPAIMDERTKKVKLLLEVRPDIKKYLENKK